MRDPKQFANDIINEINRRTEECGKLFNPIDKAIPKGYYEMLVRDVIENLIKQNQSLNRNECICDAIKDGRITQVDFVDTPKDAPTKADIEELLSCASKYENLKEVIQNMVDRLYKGGEMTLTKDSIIVLALKEAIQ